MFINYLCVFISFNCCISILLLYNTNKQYIMEQAVKVDDHYESKEFYTPLVQITSSSCVWVQAKIGDDSFINHLHIRAGARIVKIDLPSPVKFKLISVRPFTYTIGGILKEVSEK